VNEACLLVDTMTLLLDSMTLSVDSERHLRRAAAGQWTVVAPLMGGAQSARTR